MRTIKNKGQHMEKLQTYRETKNKIEKSIE